MVDAHSVILNILKLIRENIQKSSKSCEDIFLYACIAQQLILDQQSYNPMIDAKECPICFSAYAVPSNPPMYICRMKHTLCKPCLQSVYLSNKCPFCRCSLHSVQVSYDMKIMNQLGFADLTTSKLQAQNELKQKLNAIDDNRVVHNQVLYQRNISDIDYFDFRRRDYYISIYHDQRFWYGLLLFIFSAFDYLMYAKNSNPTMDVPLGVFFLPSTIRSFIRFSFWQQIITILILMVLSMLQYKFLPSEAIKIAKYFAAYKVTTLVRNLLCCILTVVMFFGLGAWQLSGICFWYLLIFALIDLILLIYAGWVIYEITR